MALTGEEPDEDIIQRSIGVFGRWHWWISFWIYLVRIPIAWTQLNIVITAPKPTFTCSNSSDKCDQHCAKHEFDKSLFTNTMITQWDLVCKDQIWADMAQTFTMLGILVGNIVFGIWSDKKGRLIPLAVAVVIQTVLGGLIAAIPWFWLVCLLRFLRAVATGGTMISSFVILMEVVGKKWRTAVGCGFMIPFILGYMSLSLVGLLFNDWRYCQLATSLPSAILFLYFCILLEFPRWLATMGQVDRAVAVLEKAARFNRLPIEDIRPNVTAFVEKNKDKPKVAGNILDLFRYRIMLVKTLCMGFNWIMIGMCYYGVSQYIGQLSGSLLVNIVVSAAMQIPGTLLSIGTMEWFGRKISMIGFNTIAGVPMLVIPFMPTTGWLRPILASISMFGLSAVFSIIYVYTAEMYPTVVRSVGCGFLAMVCRLGSIAAPHIQTLSTYIDWTCPIIFGTMSCVAAALCLFLPETRNRKLPDTIEEAEAITWRTKKNE